MNLILEKYIKVAIRKSLKEQEEKQQKAEKAMYLVYRFPGLKKIMEELMSPAFGTYVSGINVIAPKPTTFKIDLINGQNFSIKYLGKGNFNVKISGKKYDIKSLGELERASQSIADLLELNYAPEEGKEQTSGKENSSSSKLSSPSTDDLSADIEAANNEVPPSEEPAKEETPEI